MVKINLLPPASNKCQECAMEHDADKPHNALSLYYQVKYRMDHGRDADWRDAMSHCDEATKAVWVQALGEAGVDVLAGQIALKGNAKSV